MTELGLPVSNASIADLYQGLATHIIIDRSDVGDRPALQAQGLDVLVTNTMMRTIKDKTQLADDAICFLEASPLIKNGHV